MENVAETAGVLSTSLGMHHDTKMGSQHIFQLQAPGTPRKGVLAGCQRQLVPLLGWDGCARDMALLGELSTSNWWIWWVNPVGPSSLHWNDCRTLLHAVHELSMREGWAQWPTAMACQIIHLLWAMLLLPVLCLHLPTSACWGHLPHQQLHSDLCLWFSEGILSDSGGCTRGLILTQREVSSLPWTCGRFSDSQWLWQLLSLKPQLTSGVQVTAGGLLWPPGL
jgi:hypothetical protein